MKHALKRGMLCCCGRGETNAGTIIKDTWTTTKGGWKQEREVGRAGVVGRGGG